MLLPKIDASDGPRDRTSSRVALRVRFGETDLMGIVHHANYLLYLEEARVEYLLRRGVRYADWIERDLHFAVVDARLRYRTAAAFHDALMVETWVGDASRVMIRFDYRVLRGDGPSPTVISEAYTTLVCVDGKKSPRRIPQEILDIVLGPELPPAGNSP